MLDLIIPVYKNKAGLYRTLFSVGTELKDKVLVTIVDDASGDNYDDVVQLFQKVFPIRVLTLPENQGPGMARQYGLDRATQKWVCFIDCGDTFLTPTTLLEMLAECDSHEELWMASWAHQEELINDDPALPYVYKLVNAPHNRMHGKMYRRQFLENYNICFCPEMPRANEDIGFNISARLICRNASLKDGLSHIFEYDNPTVVWKARGPSIVRANDCEFYYRTQNTGMAFNAIHALKKAQEYNIDQNIILQEIYEEIAHMYCFYLITCNGREQFSEESLYGAKYYYINAFYPVKDANPEMLMNIYWDTMCGFLSDRECPICLKYTTLDFPGWLQELEKITADERKALVENTATDAPVNNDFTFEGLT